MHSFHVGCQTEEEVDEKNSCVHGTHGGTAISKYAGSAKEVLGGRQGFYFAVTI